MEFHYRARAHGHAPAAASTMVYRAASATLASQCQMWPSDSRYFDGALRRCGARRALAASLARLFLEPAASPEVLTPLVIDGRVRWVDLVEDLPCE